MLRYLIASMLFVVPVTSAAAGSSDGDANGVQLAIGQRLSSASTPRWPAASTGGVMHRTINGVAVRNRVGAEDTGMLALLDLGGEEQGLAVSVSDTVSLGVGYEYLRREDIHLEVAETGSLHEKYSTHNVVVRARWKF